jgi:hypothetical protein
MSGTEVPDALMQQREEPRSTRERRRSPEDDEEADQDETRPSPSGPRSDPYASAAATTCPSTVRRGLAWPPRSAARPVSTAGAGAAADRGRPI